MTDRIGREEGHTRKPRQLELDFQLPADVAERRQRIRAIRHHFLCLIEELPENGHSITPGQARAVRRFLKRLLKSDYTNWDGTGTFRQTELARDWIVSERAMHDWMRWGKRLGWIDAAVSTDGRAMRRTTIQVCWQAIADAVGRPVMPEQKASSVKQKASSVKQKAFTAEQKAFSVEQKALSASLFGNRLSVASASTRCVDGWAAAAADLAAVSPDLSLACLQGAKSAGVLPAEVVAIASHWRSRPGAWGVGALYRRIQRAVPSVPADRDWPPPRGVSRRVDRGSSHEFAESIRREALRSYRATPDASDAEVAADREQIMNQALEQAGLAKFCEHSAGGPR